MATANQTNPWNVNLLPARVQPPSVPVPVAVPAPTPMPEGQRAVQCTHIHPRTKKRCGNVTRNPPLCHFHVRNGATQQVVNLRLPPPPEVTTSTRATSSSVQVQMAQARQVIPPPIQVRPKYKTDTCPCCQEERNLRTFKCGHGVCDECLGNLRDITCPMCRACVHKDLEDKECHLIVQRLVDDKVDRKVQGLSAHILAQCKQAFIADMMKMKDKYEAEIRKLKEEKKEQEDIINVISNMSNMSNMSN